VGNSIHGIQGFNGSGRVGWNVNSNQTHLNLQVSFPSYIFGINYSCVQIDVFPYS
jgi:hypothetical protein